MRTKEELRALQSLDLDTKILLSKDRIRQWVQEWGEKGVYVSFSGGKDSTCLLHLVREMYPDIVAVYVDTGLEFPEIREFVKSFENVIWLKPDMNFKQVIKTYGYPFISKEVSQCLGLAKEWYKKPTETEPSYIRKLKGEYNTSFLSDYSRWSFLLEAPFTFSSKCCNVMKKKPIKKYEKETGKKGFTGSMASESKLRETQWLKTGCNAFESERPISNPLAFWTEQDVLAYIKKNDIKICDVYGDIVPCDEETQICMDYSMVQLKTTGEDRTGCMFCGFGCHLEKSPNRFERMKKTHPAIYDFVFKPVSKGGLGYKEVIDWINEHRTKQIKF